MCHLVQGPRRQVPGTDRRHPAEDLIRLDAPLPPLQFTQRIRRRDYLRFVMARWPRQFADSARRNYLGWMTVPVAVVAALASLLRVIPKAIRRFPVEQTFDLDDEGLAMQVGAQRSWRPWSAFVGVERLAGGLLLKGEAGDVLLLHARMPASQRTLLDGRLAQALPTIIDR